MTAKSAQAIAREQARRRAKQRAYTRLAIRHPGDFLILCDAEEQREPALTTPPMRRGPQPHTEAP